MADAKAVVLRLLPAPPRRHGAGASALSADPQSGHVPAGLTPAGPAVLPGAGAGAGRLPQGWTVDGGAVLGRLNRVAHAIGAAAHGYERDVTGVAANAEEIAAGPRADLAKGIAKAAGDVGSGARDAGQAFASSATAAPNTSEYWTREASTELRATDTVAERLGGLPREEEEISMEFIKRAQRGADFFRGG